MRVINRLRDWRLAIVCAAVFAAGCGERPASSVAKSEASSEAPPTEPLSVDLPGDSADSGAVPEVGELGPPDILTEPGDSVHLQLAEGEQGETPVPVPMPEPAEQELSEPELNEPQLNEPKLAEPDIIGLDPETKNAAAAPPDILEADILEDPQLVGGAPEDWRKWENPQAVLVVSGQQYGYIEPCGCTGLANQKGGLMRRATLLDEIRERGWEVLPLDAGNLIRRTGAQATIKYQTAVKGLKQLGYRAIGIGPNDLNIGGGELLSLAADDGEAASGFASANVEVLAPDLVPLYRKIEVEGRTIGVTTALDPATIKSKIDDAIIVSELKERLTATLAAMKADGCDFNVLMLFGDEEQGATVAKEVPGFNLIVAAATFGEPHYQAKLVEGTETRLVKTGDKGMYVGVIGLFADGELKYSRQPLDDQFEDARMMLDLMAEYQNRLKLLGLSGLQVKPKPHPTSKSTYVGTEKCGECHTTAYAIWQGTPHAEATEDIVHPGERSEIARHFDPECLSCHVTGWDPQGFEPYLTGYLSLEESPHLTGSGCENCHGPGSAHVEAELKAAELTEEELAVLRESVRLPLDKARERCLECHDLDNSPDFHHEGAFDDYWSQVEHYGVD